MKDDPGGPILAAGAGKNDGMISGRPGDIFGQDQPAAQAADELEFLEWCCVKLHRMGIRVLALILDNAGWHISQAVRAWVREHNGKVKQDGEGVRILVGLLPVKSP